jgi:hypothetical protein
MVGKVDDQPGCARRTTLVPASYALWGYEEPPFFWKAYLSPAELPELLPSWIFRYTKGLVVCPHSDRRQQTIAGLRNFL